MTGREQESQNKGLSRRDLIRASALAGAAAWTAPVIIESLASPAAALSGGGAFPCSYASIVFTVGGAGPYAVKFNNASTTCSDDNGTSGDATFSTTCSGSTYSNTCSGDSICKDGTVVTPYAGPCPFTYSSSTHQVTSTISDISILFVAVHDGSCAGHFCLGCAPGSSFTVSSGHCQP
jgi:hypothetical protein